jgi:hypothetical protein
MGRMWRLRRWVVSDNRFFTRCRVLLRRRLLSAFGCLARVIDARRQKHGFLLTARIFLPDNWRLIFHPPHTQNLDRTKGDL